MSKQSSVEWLQKAIYDKLHMKSDKTYGYIINKAKAMHKEEIKDAYDHYRCIGNFENGEQYYNETFGDEKVL